jgi:hypothetical protein
MRNAEISTLNRGFYMGHGARTMTEHYEHGEFPGQLAADAEKFRAFVGGAPVFKAPRKRGRAHRHLTRQPLEHPNAAGT